MTRHLMVLAAIVISANVILADVPLPNQRVLPDGRVIEYWWSEEMAGWLGGLIGGTVGLLGAAFGICAGLGLARSLLPTATLVAACTGVAILLAGMVAVATGQPCHVYYILLLIGGITAFVFGFNYPMIKRRAQQIEMQQIRAMDS